LSAWRPFIHDILLLYSTASSVDRADRSITGCFQCARWIN
jgi:hypothetical protein